MVNYTVVLVVNYCALLVVDYYVMLVVNYCSVAWKFFYVMLGVNYCAVLRLVIVTYIGGLLLSLTYTGVITAVP